MDVIQALDARFACRAFRPEPVGQTTVKEILQAALRAPSWANTQPWEVFVASGEVLERLRQASLARARAGSAGRLDVPAPAAWPPELQRRMQEAMGERFRELGVSPDDETARQANLERAARFFDAPVVVWLCLDRELTAWSMFDLGAFAQSIMLAAQEFGVASLPAVMLARHPDLVRAELGVPDHLSVVLGIALGYADLHDPQNRFRSKRRPIEEVVRFKGF